MHTSSTDTYFTWVGGSKFPIWKDGCEVMVQYVHPDDVPFGTRISLFTTVLSLPSTKFVGEIWFERETERGGALDKEVCHSCFTMLVTVIYIICSVKQAIVFDLVQLVEPLARLHISRIPRSLKPEFCNGVRRWWGGREVVGDSVVECRRWRWLRWWWEYDGR